MDENEETEGQQVDENKEDENKEGGQLPEIQVNVEKNKKKSKYHTLNIFGFTLAFQV